MNEHHQSLIRALIAAQVAVIEHADLDVMADGTEEIAACRKCLAEAAKRLRALERGA